MPRGGLRRADLGSDPLGGGLIGEPLQLEGASLGAPAELARKDLAHAGDGTAGLGEELTRGQQPEPGSAQEHVPDASRLLVAGRQRRLRKQVGLTGDDRMGQLFVLGSQREHLVGGVAIAGRERRVGLL